MADDLHHMSLDELLAFVAALNAKYRRWTPLPVAQCPDAPRRNDLVRLRASIQGCLEALDRLLTE